ncbi:hypothetical protein JCM6882_004727 [Rhodosporidiobolus microsporus]
MSSIFARTALALFNGYLAIIYLIAGIALVAVSRSQSDSCSEYSDYDDDSCMNPEQPLILMIVGALFILVAGLSVCWANARRRVLGHLEGPGEVWQRVMGTLPVRVFPPRVQPDVEAANAAHPMQPVDGYKPVNV